MTKAKASPATRRRGSGRRWHRPFLAKLADTSNVRQAARAAKVSTSTVYKERRDDPAFNRRWQEALAEGYDNLEMELLFRLRDGELEGGAAGPARKARRRYDNAVALRLLAAHRDSVGRQRAHQLAEDEETVFAAISAKLERMRQHDLAAGLLVEGPDGIYRPALPARDGG